MNSQEAENEEHTCLASILLVRWSSDAAHFRVALPPHRYVQGLVSEDARLHQVDNIKHDSHPGWS